VVVLFVIVVFKVWFVTLFQKAIRGFEPIIYRGVLLSALLHAILYVGYTIC
jgi:hypothetical protein